MKKKVLSVLLASAMALSMAACGGSPSTSDSNNNSNGTQQGGGDAQEDNGGDADGGGENGGTSASLDGSYPAETVKIGFVGYDNTAEQQMAIQEYFDYLSEKFNIEIMYSENLADAEGELNFISDCAAAGCKAIIGYYNEALSEAAKTAADYGMYYWGGFGGDEAEVEAAKTACGEYYLGGYTLGKGDYEGGRSMALALAEQGCEKVVLCSGGASFGVSMFVDRKEGFMAGIEEAKGNGSNIEVVKEVEGWPGTDSFTADQTAVMGMDVDAIASTFDVAMWFQPIMESGKAESIKLAAIGEVSDTYYDFFNSGLVSVIVYDNEEVIFGNAIPMILNAVSGNKLVDADGNGILFEVQRWTITTPEEFNAVYDLHDAGNWIVTAEDIADMIVDLNPDANADTLQEFYGSFGIDKVMQ